jgi:predicted RNA binding protein YcfA (HicA-like mRNA interferase family)
LSFWPSSKAKKVRKALGRIGWEDDPSDTKGSSHQKLIHPSLPNYTWAFEDSEEIGPKMIARIAKQTGLKPNDL